MNKKTLAALKGSIAKWKKVADGTGVDDGESNCPLCQLFIDDDCTGCPVAKAAGEPGCTNTPFVRFRWEFAVAQWSGYKATTLKQKSAARAELKFLRSLLPKKRVAK